MKTIKLLLLLSIFTKLNAVGQTFGQQNSNMITFKDCMYSPFVIEDGRHQISFKSSKSLTEYITDSTDIDIRKTIQGEINVQIIIRYDGKVCCKSLQKKNGSFSLDELKTLKLEKAFNSLPNFTIGKPEEIAGMPGNYSTLLNIRFKNNGVIEIYDYIEKKVI